METVSVTPRYHSSLLGKTLSPQVGGIHSLMDRVSDFKARVFDINFKARGLRLAAFRSVRSVTLHLG